jgi:hypothetical protein
MARTKRAYTQWTADTEIAFIMALRFHGRATLAAAEIGRTVAGAYLRRDRCPDFAAKWQDALDQWRRAHAATGRAAVGLDDPDAPSGTSPNPPHFDGWTPIRRRAFLRVLGETGKVPAACAQIGLTERGAYALRRRDPSFAAAWDRALVLAPATLEQVAFERAVEGIEEPVFHAGKQVGTRRRYSDSLMRELLATRERRERLAREEAAAKVKMVPAPTRTPEEALASFIKKLETVERRVEGDRVAAEARAWRDWQASWTRFGKGVGKPRVPVQEILPPLTPAEAGKGARLRRA